MKFCCLIILLLPNIFTSLYAAPVLPEFTGKWYTTTMLTETKNACGKTTYRFNHLANTPADVIADVLGETSLTNNGCQFKKTAALFSGNYFDTSFPGTRQQQAKIKQRDSVKPQVWQVKCGDADPVTYTVRPQYQCPKGTVLANYYDAEQHKVLTACHANPQCTGDVVARELDITFLHKQGHVGFILGPLDDNSNFIAHYPQENLPQDNQGRVYLLEVLWNDDVINLRPFDYFISKPNYWGERYGVKTNWLASKQPLDLTKEQGDAIAMTGYLQSFYNPKYTILPRFEPGHAEWIYNPDLKQHELVKVIKNAMFRCDTFIYYVYLQGAGIDLLQGHHLSLNEVRPYKIFQLFSESRQNSYIDQVTPVPFFDPQSVHTTINPESLVSNIMDLLASDAITTDEKVENLMAQLMQKDIDEEKQLYYLDALYTLKPVAHTSELIHLYQQVENIKVKILVLDVLSRAVTMETEQEYLRIKNYYWENFNEVKQFFLDVSLNEKEPILLATAIKYFPYIYSPEQANSHVHQIKASTTDPVIKERLLKTQLELSMATDKIQPSLSIEKNEYSPWLQQFKHFLKNQ